MSLCVKCTRVSVPPASEGGTGLCESCTTKCVLCGRVRELAGNTAVSGMLHARHRQGWGIEMLYFDWLCWECISTKSLREYFSALYGEEYVRLFVIE